VNSWLAQVEQAAGQISLELVVQEATGHMVVEEVEADREQRWVALVVVAAMVSQ
jgi:hypothetical protein